MVNKNDEKSEELKKHNMIKQDLQGAESGPNWILPQGRYIPVDKRTKENKLQKK